MKKANDCTVSFYVDFFIFGCNVIQKSSSDIYFSYPCGQQKSDKKGYILKANDQVTAFIFQL